MNNPTQPYLSNPILRRSYSVIAPLYDLVIERPMRNARTQSLRHLQESNRNNILICGVGTGLDLPLVPTIHQYTAIDFNAPMMARAKKRSHHLDVNFVLGDCMTLPFGDAQFDHIILHLIVAVVPDPILCFKEATRVLKPGGTIILFDKFLHPQQHAPVRRLLNFITRRLATRMDVVFEDLLPAAPELDVKFNAPLLGNGWFRSIVLIKRF